MTDPTFAPVPTPSPGRFYRGSGGLRISTFALAALFAIRLTAIFVPGDTLAIWTSVALLFGSLLLLVSPALVFAAFTFRERTLPQALRQSAASSAIIFILIGALIAWASSIRPRDTLIGIAMIAFGTLVLVRARWGGHDWDASSAESSIYRRFVAVGAAAVLLVMVQIVFEKTRWHPHHSQAQMTMTSDLRNLLIAEEGLHSDSGRYATVLEPRLFQPSASVIGPAINLTSDGWTARARHEGTPMECVIFIGSTPIAPAVREGEPACTPDVHAPRKPVWPDAALYALGALVALGAARKPRVPAG